MSMTFRHYALPSILFVCTIALFTMSMARAENEPKVYAGRNINMVSGVAMPNESGQRVALGGDPYLQRQNEPSIAVSTRNPMHLLAGANDYRTVGQAGEQGEEVVGDSWLGLFKSFDGGRTWQSTLFPGYPQAQNAQEGKGNAINAKQYEAAADPTVRAGTNGMFYYSGIAFDREDPANPGAQLKSAVFVSHLIDLNNREGAFFDVPDNEDPIKFIGINIIEEGNRGQFLDKPSLAVDIPRGSQDQTFDINDTDPSGQPIVVEQTINCGNVYLAYSNFTGASGSNPQNSKIYVSRSTDCGKTWSKKMISDNNHRNQGTTIAIDPQTGHVYVAWLRFDHPSQNPAIIIAKSNDGGENFENVLEEVTDPFNQGTRPSPEINGDHFRMFRTNGYPALAVDHQGRVYVAWSARGYWGADNPPPGDQTKDGARVMVKHSSPGGETWNTDARPADLSDLPGPTDPSDPSTGCHPVWNPAKCRTGHHIMPSFSYVGRKLALLYYDLRNDYYPDLFNRILELSCEPIQDPVEKAACIAKKDQIIPADTSWPPADAIAFDPLPIRHTIETRVLVAEATDNSAADFSQQQSIPVSKYLSTFIWDSTSGTSGAYTEVQLQSNQVNLPLFSGGTSPFIGDYIDITASRTFVTEPDPANPGKVKWVYNNSTDAQVFHATWTDNRDVVPPPVRTQCITTPSGTKECKLVRPDWTNYETPQDVVVCDENSWPGMRNQNIYSSRVTQGLVLGSYGNSKPLNVDRTYSIFVENTIPEIEEYTYDDNGVQKTIYLPSGRSFKVTLDTPTGAEACLKPFSNGSCPQADMTVAVNSLSNVSLTVFAKSTDIKNPLITVVAEEVDDAGNLIDGGLRDSIVLNPDPTNPEILSPGSSNQISDVEFIQFSCADFETLPSEVNINCADFSPYSKVDYLKVEWPNLLDPNDADFLNPALLNTTQNPALLNPALLNPALLNPALLNPALLNPALLNPALLNPALLNPALLNPALLNPALLNPALLNPALLNPALLNPALLNPALLNPALLNPALLNPALLNPALLNPALLNPALLNPALLNPALLNPAPGDETLDYFQGLATSSVFLRDQNGQGPLSGNQPDSPTLTDLTWKVRNAGNVATSYFVSWFSSLKLKPIQILFYRTYQTPTADLNNCSLTEAGLHYEVLGNILDPSLLTPGQLDRAMTFSLAPSWMPGAVEDDYVYITMRFLEDPNEQISADQFDIGVVSSPDPDDLITTTTLLSTSTNEADYGDTVIFTAMVMSGTGDPVSGSVLFYDSSTLMGIGSLSNGTATYSTSALSGGTHSTTAEYIGTSDFAGSTSSPVVVAINKADQIINFPPPAGKAFGDPPFDLNATATSELTVSYAILSGPATVSGSTVTITGIGNVTVRAMQSGSGNYNPAPPVDQTFGVTIPLGAQLNFEVQPVSTGTNQSISVQVMAKSDTGIRMPGVCVTLAIGSNPGGGMLNGGNSATTDSNGIASFSVSIGAPGSGYTLVASATGLSVTSDAFNITYPMLIYETQPTSTGANHTITVRIRAHDSAGAIIPGQIIKLAIQDNPGGGTLHGTTSATANIGGLASFKVSIDALGSGYTLVATTAPPMSVTAVSKPFDITVPNGAKLEFDNQPQTTEAIRPISLSSGGVKIKARNPNGSPILNVPVSIKIKNQPSPDIPVSVAGTIIRSTAAGGIATFDDLSIQKVGDGYRLEASASEFQSETSNDFDIILPSDAVVTFLSQPGSTPAYLPVSGPVQVQATSGVVPIAGLSLDLDFGPLPSDSYEYSPGSTDINGIYSPQVKIFSVGTHTFTVVEQIYTNGALSLQSNPFDITIPASSKLAFSRQPKKTKINQPIGAPQGVKVKALCDDGPLGNVSITIGLASNLYIGSLGGTNVAVTDSSGEAAFTTLTINAVAEGYQLSASAPSFSTVESKAFDITDP